jgi:hypothetical protein
MKFYKISIISLGAVAVSFLYMSCNKSNIKLISPTSTEFNNKAFVQVYNGTLNSARNYVYVDGNAMTGATVAYGATFPSTPSNFSVTSGIRAFLIRDTSSTILTQPFMSFGANFETNKYYTIFMYDTLTSPKQKMVNNDIIIPADTTARVRFANFIFSKTAVPNVDLYSVKRAANVFTNVAVTDVTGYIPFNSAVITAASDTLLVRETGTTILLAQLNAYMPIAKRSYTLVLRGSYKAATPAKTLSSFSSN